MREEQIGKHFATFMVNSSLKHAYVVANGISSQMYRIMYIKLDPHERKNFSKYCDDLCNCTTVAQYDEIFAELKTIGVKYPEVQAFLKYWDFRKSHVFGPFQGCGVPGVNLSEPANQTFKPPQTLSLVEAAKYDVAMMMWQETQIDLFEKESFCDVLDVVLQKV